MAIGANNKPAISVGTSGSIKIEEGATLRAYTNGAYAIKGSDNLGTASIVNAYYANNEVADTFASLSSINNTDIICDAQGVSLPKDYSSFAYSTTSGDYEHQYSDGTNQYSLVQLNDNVNINATQSFEATPLKKALIYEIRYYKNAVDSANLLGTINENGTFIANNPVRREIKTMLSLLILL